MNTTNPKPVFLYLNACQMSERQLKKIREAGYVTVPVDSFDSVRIAEPIQIPIGGTQAAMKAAFHALATSEYSAPVIVFGKTLAKALAGEANSVPSA